MDGKTFRRHPSSQADRFDLRRGIPLSGAAEQMFFFGAPLAHVVAYEERQRQERLWRTYRRHARATLGLDLPPQTVGEPA